MAVKISCTEWASSIKEKTLSLMIVARFNLADFHLPSKTRRVRFTFASLKSSVLPCTVLLVWSNWFKGLVNPQLPKTSRHQSLTLMSLQTCDFPKRKSTLNTYFTSSFKFRMTWGWITDDFFFFLGWTILLTWLKVIFSSCTYVEAALKASGLTFVAQTSYQFFGVSLSRTGIWNRKNQADLHWFSSDWSSRPMTKCEQKWGKEKKIG